MPVAVRVLLIVLFVLIALLVVLYFVGRRMQKRQSAQQEQMEAMKQTVSMLIIDKKMLPVKSSGLPQSVIDQTPKYLRRSKMPIVKAKVGPRVMTLIADSQAYDLIPVKKEVKATISGIYIMDVKGVRGQQLERPQTKKKGIRARMIGFISRHRDVLDEQNSKKDKKNKNTAAAAAQTKDSKSKDKKDKSSAPVKTGKAKK